MAEEGTRAALTDISPGRGLTTTSALSLHEPKSPIRSPKCWLNKQPVRSNLDDHNTVTFLKRLR